jgi:hypothetical protein
MAKRQNKTSGAGPRGLRFSSKIDQKKPYSCTVQSFILYYLTRAFWKSTELLISTKRRLHSRTGYGRDNSIIKHIDK